LPSRELPILIAKAVPHEECPGLRCHEGILHVAAKMMLDDTLHLIENLFIP
jgi:hypothetical protein